MEYVLVKWFERAPGTGYGELLAHTVSVEADRTVLYWAGSERPSRTLLHSKYICEFSVNPYNSKNTDALLIKQSKAKKK